MSQANPGDGDENSAAMCSRALQAALEKGATYCDSTEDRLEVLGGLVGIDGDTIDVDDVLDEGPITDENAEQTRAWVAARAAELLDGTEDSPLDAINQAWGEVGDHLGDETGDEDVDADDDGADEVLEEADEDADDLADELGEVAEEVEGEQGPPIPEDDGDGSDDEDES